jgi:hypothetical protein
MSLSLSRHSRDEAYLGRINAAIRTINSWIAEFGVKVQPGDNIAKWNRFHEGIGRNMEPFDGDVRASWKVCHSQHCCNLIDNRLWICSRTGNLHPVAEKSALHENRRRTKYLEFTGIGLASTDDEPQRWLHVRAGLVAVYELCPAPMDNSEKDIYDANHDLPDVDRHEKSGSQARTWGGRAGRYPLSLEREACDAPGHCEGNEAISSSVRACHEIAALRPR